MRPTRSSISTRDMLMYSVVVPLGRLDNVTLAGQAPAEKAHGCWLLRERRQALRHWMAMLAAIPATMSGLSEVPVYLEPVPLPLPNSPLPHPEKEPALPVRANK